MGLIFNKWQIPVIYGAILMSILTSCGITAPNFFPTYNEQMLSIDTLSSMESSWTVRVKPNDSLNPSINKWYSKHLNSMREPVIYNNTNPNRNIVRVTFLPTWGNPTSYRIEQEGLEISITFSRTNGQGGYHAGRRVVHKTIKMDNEKWECVVSKMDSINFWNIGTHDPNMILDGVEWIFEASINGYYHLVTRNCPDIYDGKDFAELCSLIVQIYKEQIMEDGFTNTCKKRE